jgi:phenylacetate-CoA ligase
MAVTIELNPEAHSSINSDRRSEIAKQLQHQVKTNIGINVKVLLADPVALERSSGKACRVIDRRGKAAEEAAEYKATERGTQ